MSTLKDGRPQDTTMGFSALGGIMMGTRSGDLDPGILLYLVDVKGYDCPAYPDAAFKWQTRRKIMKVEFANFEDMLKAVQDLPAMPTAVIDADERHVLEGACEAAEE